MSGAANFFSGSGVVIEDCSVDERGMASFPWALGEGGADNLPMIVWVVTAGARVPMVQRVAKKGRRVAVWGRLTALQGGDVGVFMDWFHLIQQ